jgi:hypothetical protein
MRYFRYCGIPVATASGPANPQRASPIPTRSNCYWTTGANVSESKAEDIGTWWLTVLAVTASQRSTCCSKAGKYNKALVAAVALPEKINNTGLRSCLCRTTG